MCLWVTIMMCMRMWGCAPPQIMLLPIVLLTRASQVHHLVCLTSLVLSVSMGHMRKQRVKGAVGGVGLEAWLCLLSPHQDGPSGNADLPRSPHCPHHAPHSPTLQDTQSS